MWYGVPHRAVVCWKHTREGINHETDACTKYRTQRKAHSLTQENLAEAIGVTVGAVSKWENGTTSPDLVTLMGWQTCSVHQWMPCWATSWAATRRSAGQPPAKMPLPPAAWRFTRPGGRNGRQANPCADGKGAGGEHPGAACDNL